MTNNELKISRLHDYSGVKFYISALADRDNEIEYTFSFKVKETGQTFNYSTKLKTTYKP